MFGNVPALVNVQHSLTKREMVEIISHGKGAMPSFVSLGEEKIESVVNFLRGYQRTVFETKKRTGHTLMSSMVIPNTWLLIICRFLGHPGGNSPR